MDPQPSQSGRSAADSPASSSRTSLSLAKSVSDAGSQSLSSILNNPHAGKSDASWVGWWSSSSYIAPPEFNPIVTAKATSELARSDFQPYLSSISESYNRFEDIRKHASKEGLEVDGVGGGQGEALVACLREVPALYFKEDFALEEGATFRAACPFTNVSQNLVLQEKLSQYLDVVELHLVKEISLRSNSFFEAQVQLQDLNVKIVEGCKRIRELKETIRLLDADLVDPAREVQNLYNTRSNMLTLQRKLRLVLYVNQALSALKLLVASADCAGALDVTDVLQQLLEGDELTGLHCFRHLREHVAGAIDSVNSILSAEFMRASIHDAGVADSVILSKAKVRVSIFVNGKDELDLSEEDTLSFRDRLLPLVIGLLRTAKLPSVLRLYRDTLTADMKSAIKTAVEELLPALSARPSDTDLLPGERTVDADGGGSLASKLRSLTSESFVQLLSTIFRIVQAHLVRAAEVKRAIEWIMCNLDGHYAADTVAAAIALGAMAVESTQDADGQGAPLVLYSTLRAGAKFSSSLGKANDLTTNMTNISKNFRADVLRENTEAVFAACDSAHGRWAKLLGVRALLHPRLRLQEFLSIYNITHEFIHLTEKVGGRLGYSIRGTLQSQAKAFIDFQHESRMTKLKAVLDQETWAEVDVPDEFQEIVTSLFNSEVSDSQNTEDSERNISNNYDGVEGNNNGPVVADQSSQVSQEHQQHVVPSDPNSKTVSQPKSSTSTDTVSKGQTDVVVPASSMNSNLKDRGKPTAQMLLYAGVGYHMVNCGLILLKLLSEYIDMNNFLPALSSEVVHRVVEILKFFNTRSCQLVLGAGAMQVSGLKSITSKHLALASQVISFTYSIIPEIRRTLFLNVPEPRKALLLSEFNRVAEDYKVHRDEIHTKLVQIMRERLLFHLRGLRQIVESWNRSEVDDSQPSSFAQNLTKEIILLRRVLVRTLHEVDVRAIMRQVVIMVHAQISEAYYHLEFTTPLARERLQRDIKHILNCIRALPTDDQNDSVPRNWGQLDQFLVQRFGEEAA